MASSDSSAASSGSSSSPAGNIHCPQCGKANPHDFKFCLGCGHDLASARAAFDAAASSSPSIAANPAQALAALRALGAMAGGNLSSMSMSGSAQTLPTVPPPPRDPSPRARGLIHAYTGSQSVKRLLGAIFSIIGLALFAGLGNGLVVDVIIMAAGQPQKGKVLDVRIVSNVEVNGTHPREIRYEYGAHRHRGSSSTLDISWASSLQQGQTIDVEAVPGYPSLSRVKGTSASILGWFSAFFLIFAAVGLPLFFSAVLSNRREIRAFKHGHSTIGRVTSFGPDFSVKVNGRHPTLLKWQFDADGKTFNGSLTHMDPQVLMPLVAAGKVAVVYDKKDPRANTLYVP